MKKIILILVVLGILTFSLGSVGSAHAQDINPPQPRGPMMSGTGILHSYMIAAMAKSLNMNATDFEARVQSGETFYQIALSKGFKAEEIPSLMQSAHTEAINKAVADGVITQEQADWMLQHMGGRGMVGGRGRNGGMGRGPCNGTGTLPGQGGRWSIPGQ